MEARHVLIEGRVQGVGFRAWAERTARRLGVVGWVRNLSDGQVEAWFEGDLEALAQVVAACRSGPESSRVTRLRVASRPTQGFEQMLVRESAWGPIQEQGFKDVP